MAVLQVHRLVKRYGVATAVDDISFEVDAGEILVIVGGSGCGKTTTLRCIAGLEDVTDGTIRLEQRVVAARGLTEPPEKRGIGMVFQSYAIWPHKTVSQNVGYGLERKGLSRSEIRENVQRALQQVGLADYAERYPSTLSGGQQQRVALARCAAMRPKLLLLDEPLSNLDAKLRERMREEIRDMIKALGMTAVHITHDQSEAMALADRVVCLREGRVMQIGSPREIYRTPHNRFVADFIGACSFLDGRIVEGSTDPSYVLVEIAPSVRLRARAPATRRGENVSVAIRPEAVALLDQSGEDGLTGRVTKAVFLGPHTEYVLDLGGACLKSHSARDIPVGALCALRIDPDQAACVPE